LRLRLSWTALALGAILLVGAGLLFSRIDSVPREMTSDHAEKLLDVADVLDGQHRIFFPRNTGREAFQFYWIALMTPLTGVSYLTMKLGTALLAWGTLPFTYVLARTMFGVRFALLATAVLAGMRWLWQVGRVGLRFPFPPLFGAAVWCFLIRALRDRRRSDFLLCGLMLGIAQHTYTALRIAPFGVVGCIAIAAAADYWRTRSLERLRPLAVNTVLLFGISGLVFMPLARYAYDDPQMFLFRGVTRMASDSADRPPTNIPAVFLENVKNAFLMFNWKGDLVWVNHIPTERMLDPIGGALFLLGCAYALYRLVRHRELPYAYLLVLLFIGLLPSIMSLAFPIENPSTVRMGMAIPITAIVVALPLYLLAGRLRAWVGGRPGALTAGVGLALVLAAMLRVNVDQYFRIYPEQHARASQHSWHVARAINGFIAMGGRRQDAHILPGPNWVDWRLVAIQAGDVRWQALLPNIDQARQHDGAAGPRLYVLHPGDRGSLEALQRWYPGAIAQTHVLEDAGNNPWFVTVLVPPGARAVL
jgi:4-amino-4-deoxy-L-arabinose transferase-like glycosyltransferase